MKRAHLIAPLLVNVSNVSKEEGSYLHMPSLDDVGPPALAFVLAGGFAFAELLTTKYPRTAFLIVSPRRCWPLYLYAFTYAVTGAVLTIILSYLIANHILRVEGLGLDRPWVRAIYVGVAAKSFLQFTLFSIGEERVGITTITKMFEPAILRTIDLDENHFVNEYLNRYTHRYSTIEEVRKRFSNDEIPQGLPEEERKGLEMDIRYKEDEPRPAMRAVLKKMGKRSFNRIFPL